MHLLVVRMVLSFSVSIGKLTVDFTSCILLKYLLEVHSIKMSVTNALMTLEKQLIILLFTCIYIIYYR